MAKKKGKSVSFDAMVKFFLQHYSIPTKGDIDKLSNKVERLERILLSQQSGKGKRGVAAKAGVRSYRRKKAMSASDTVLEVVKRFKNGVGFAAIQERTGFEDKKLRNIIFRLNKLQRITRKSRGLYIAT